jgi:hypothetical protein
MPYVASKWDFNVRNICKGTRTFGASLCHVAFSSIVVCVRYIYECVSLIVGKATILTCYFSCVHGWMGCGFGFFFSDEAVAALKDGMEQLKMIQRQAIVSSLYPSSKSVME